MFFGFKGTTKILAQIGQDTAITEQQVKIVKQQLEKIKKLKKLLPEYQVHKVFSNFSARNDGGIMNPPPDLHIHLGVIVAI